MIRENEDVITFCVDVVAAIFGFTLLTTTVVVVVSDPSILTEEYNYTTFNYAALCGAMVVWVWMAVSGTRDAIDTYRGDGDL